ncbi:MAG: hypothetical protein R2712_04050 [Vicinamibacterales bacterium]
MLFFDRQHNRARAYIERARSAQAEGHRQAEALVHEGLDAFDRGDVDQARALLHDAMERGAPHDLALGVLDRIDRLDVTGTRDVAVPPARRPFRPRSRTGIPAAARTRPWSRFWALTATIALALGVASWWASTTGGWSDSWARRPINRPAPRCPRPSVRCPCRTWPRPGWPAHRSCSTPGGSPMRWSSSIACLPGTRCGGVPTTCARAFSGALLGTSAEALPSIREPVAGQRPE